MCLWIYQGGRFPLSLEMPLIYRAEDSSLSLFAPPKCRREIFCYHKQYRHSLRTVGDSLKEHNSPHPILLNCYTFFLHNTCLNILIIRHALYQTYVCMVLERTSYKLLNLCSIILYIFNQKICLN